MPFASPSSSFSSSLSVLFLLFLFSLSSVSSLSITSLYSLNVDGVFACDAASSTSLINCVNNDVSNIMSLSSSVSGGVSVTDGADLPSTQLQPQLVFTLPSASCTLTETTTPVHVCAANPTVMGTTNPSKYRYICYLAPISSSASVTVSPTFSGCSTTFSNSAVTVNWIARSTPSFNVTETGSSSVCFPSGVGLSSCPTSSALTSLTSLSITSNTSLTYISSSTAAQPQLYLYSRAGDSLLCDTSTTIMQSATTFTCNMLAGVDDTPALGGFYVVTRQGTTFVSQEQGNLTRYEDPTYISTGGTTVGVTITEITASGNSCTSDGEGGLTNCPSTSTGTLTFVGAYFGPDGLSPVTLPSSFLSSLSSAYTQLCVSSTFAITSSSTATCSFYGLTSTVRALLPLFGWEYLSSSFTAATALTVAPTTSSTPLYLDSQKTTIVTACLNADQLQITTNGDVYVACQGNGLTTSAVKYTASTQSQAALSGTCGNVQDTTIDYANNVYMTCQTESIVMKWASSGTSTGSALTGTCSGVNAVTTDSNGNVYAACSSTIKMWAGVGATGTPISLSGSCSGATSLTTDSSLNVYAACKSTNSIVKWAASSGSAVTTDTTQTTLSGTCSSAQSVATDGTNVFAACSSAILMWFSGSGSPLTLPGTCSGAYSVSVASGIGVFAACQTSASILYWQSPTPSFASSSSAPYNYPVTVTSSCDKAQGVSVSSGGLLAAACANDHTVITWTPYGVTSVTGDPQFVGFLGQHFQVHGTPGNVYSIISSSWFQFNAKFVFLVFDSKSNNKDEVKQITPSHHRSKEYTRPDHYAHVHHHHGHHHVHHHGHHDSHHAHLSDRHDDSDVHRRLLTGHHNGNYLGRLGLKFKFDVTHCHVNVTRAHAHAHPKKNVNLNGEAEIHDSADTILTLDADRRANKMLQSSSSSRSDVSSSSSSSSSSDDNNHDVNYGELRILVVAGRHSDFGSIRFTSSSSSAAAAAATFNRALSLGIGDIVSVESVNNDNNDKPGACSCSCSVHLHRLSGGTLSLSSSHLSLLLTNEGRFLNIKSAELNHDEHDEYDDALNDYHGLLGQTAWSKKMPGSVEDYVVSHEFADDAKFNRY